MGSQFLAFLGIAVLVIVTPGQDIALVIRNTLAGGRRSGIFTAFGVVVGQATWTLAAAAGVVALLLASERAFQAVRFAGAVYLMFLGAQALRAALRMDGAAHAVIGRRAGRALSSAIAFRQGVISNLGNPKVAVFFTSLLPQFTPADRASFLPMLMLGFVFASLTLVWLTSYAFVVAKTGDWLRRPEIRRLVEGLTGAVLVGLGLRLAVERR